MAMTKGARQFGNIRTLPSGRFQARYTGPDSVSRSAPHTFERKRDASRWLSLREAEILKGEWIAPELGEQKFREYAEAWMRDRVLKPRTAELYGGLLDNHLNPTFGGLSLCQIDAAAVRRWRKAQLQAGSTTTRPFGPVTVAKAYRLLHAIFETAAEEDRVIVRNPCQIKGAGHEESDEREIVPLPLLFELADTVPVRYRALLLLATFADMRWGELAGLRRENIDLDTCEIRITETLVQPGKGGLLFDTPKSQAGKRTVAFPEEIAPEIRWHLARFAEPAERGLVFIGPKGGRLRRSNFHESVWSKAREEVGLPDLHIHDLRHSGATLSAATGATLKELMTRLGHSSPRAALIYQHASRDRDREVAKALGVFAQQARGTSHKQRTRMRADGTKMAWRCSDQPRRHSKSPPQQG
jgi:integrase